MSLPRYRCSSLPRILGCNGSLTVFPLVKERESDEGHEGTMLHHMIAETLVREHGAVPPNGGLAPPDVPDGYKVPQASLWIVGWAVRHVLDTIPADWSLMVEVEMSNDFETFGLDGHADILAISPDGTRAKQKDWKSGPKPVEPAPTNEQVAGYLGLAKLEWPSIMEIEGEICQPRADEDSGFQRVSSVTIGSDRIDLLAPTLDRRIRAAQLNTMEIETGITQCAHCVGCSCPAIQAEEDLMKMTLTPQLLSKIKKEPDDTLLADFELKAKILAGPMEQAHEMLVERLKKNRAMITSDGTPVTMKTQGGKFKVTNPQGAWDAVTGLVPQDRMKDVVTYSKGRLIDVIAEVKGVHKGGKDAVTGESIFEQSIAPNMEQGEKNIIMFGAAL